MLFWNKRFHCDRMFMRFVDPSYTEEDRAAKVYRATKPDVEQAHKPTSKPVIDDQLSLLTDPEDAAKARAQLDKMLAAAESDFGKSLGLVGPVDIKWVDALDHHFDRRRLKELVRRSSTAADADLYLVTAIEFAMVMARVLRDRRPTLRWRVTSPYWESMLFDPPTGTTINIFHWAVKKLSSYGMDDGFAEKIGVCIQMMEDAARASEDGD